MFREDQESPIRGKKYVITTMDQTGAKGILAIFFTYVQNAS